MVVVADLATCKVVEEEKRGVTDEHEQGCTNARGDVEVGGLFKDGLQERHLLGHSLGQFVVLVQHKLIRRAEDNSVHQPGGGEEIGEAVIEVTVDAPPRPVRLVWPEPLDEDLPSTDERRAQGHR